MSKTEKLEFVKLLLIDSEYPDQETVLEDFILINPDKDKIKKLNLLMHGEDVEDDTAFDIFENIYEFIENNFNVIAYATDISETVKLYW